MTTYEPVIGIETHVELLTTSKMFCGCEVSFGSAPNTKVSPVCLALPGALPVPNESAIDGIVAIGLALGCQITEHSLFHRKNYFYPDLPKNYQISQYDVPLCVGGHLDVETDEGTHRVGITRVHMEEDTGKSTHVGDGGGRIHDAEHSLVDFNRSGVPLVEIVTEPDIRSADQGRAYGQELQQIIRALGVSDAKLEEGRMRFDVNVSVRPVGQEEFGTRAEVKNVNSLRSLHRSIDFEIARQIELLEAGGTVVQETRHWNEESGKTVAGRSKEEAEDYRYFQEPDLVPLHVDDAWRDRISAAQPELPASRRARYTVAGVDPATALTLSTMEGFGDVFDAALDAGGDARTVGIWLTDEVVAHLRREGGDLESTPLTGSRLAELSSMVTSSELSATAAKDVLAGVLAGEGEPREVAQARDLMQISDSGALETAVDEALAANPDVLERLRAGDMKPIGFLVGQVMKATGGKADPKAVTEIIRSRASS